MKAFPINIFNPPKPSWTNPSTPKPHVFRALNQTERHIDSSQLELVLLHISVAFRLPVTTASTISRNSCHCHPALSQTSRQKYISISFSTGLRQEFTRERLIHIHTHSWTLKHPRFGAFGTSASYWLAIKVKPKRRAASTGSSEDAVAVGYNYVMSVRLWAHVLWRTRGLETPFQASLITGFDRWTVCWWVLSRARYRIGELLRATQWANELAGGNGSSRSTKYTKCAPNRGFLADETARQTASSLLSSVQMFPPQNRKRKDHLITSFGKLE